MHTGGAFILLFLGSAACLGPVCVCYGQSKNDECVGLMHSDKQQVWLGGGKGEGEGICIIDKTEEQRVTAICSAGEYCRVKGLVELCKDSGECVEVKYITSVAVEEPERFPSFTDFPISRLYSGRNARPNITNPQAREFRTRLIQAAGSKPNFAGHYVVAQWGCGTACMAGAVIDVISGEVVFFPFQYVCCWRSVDSDFEPIRFLVNSRLIIFSGQLHDEGEKGDSFFYF